MDSRQERSFGAGWMNLDRAVAWSAVTLFGVLSLAMLPGPPGIVVAGTGMAAFAVVLGAARVVGRDHSGFGVMGATLACAMAVFFVVRNGVHVRGALEIVLPVGAGYAGALLWVGLQYAPRPPLARMSAGDAYLRLCVATGSAYLVVLVVMAIGITARRGNAVPALLVNPSLISVMIGIAVLFWHVQGISHRPTGLYLVGVLCGTWICAAMVWAIALTTGEPESPLAWAYIAVTIGMVLGPTIVFRRVALR